MQELETLVREISAAAVEEPGKSTASRFTNKSLTQGDVQWIISKTPAGVRFTYLPLLFQLCPDRYCHLPPPEPESLETLAPLFRLVDGIYFPESMEDTSLLFNGKKARIYEGLENKMYVIDLTYSIRDQMLVYRTGKGFKIEILFENVVEERPDAQSPEITAYEYKCQITVKWTFNFTKGNELIERRVWLKTVPSLK
jgi:hypothetical protein